MADKRWVWQISGLNGKWVQMEREPDDFVERTKSVEERVRQNPVDALGFALELPPATKEEAELLKQSGYILGGSIDQYELWFKDPERQWPMEQEQEDGRKIGAGHASAMLRAGFKELSQVLPAFPASSVQPVEEPGLFGNLTPQEVVDTKGPEQSYENKLNSYSARPQPEQSQEQER